MHRSGSIGGADSRCRTWFRSRSLIVGTFEIRPLAPTYGRSRTIESHVIVFPRYANWIRISGKVPFVADPRAVLAFNRAQTYTREPIHPAGDFGFCFAPSGELLEDVLSGRGRRGLSARHRPFDFQYASADRSTILLQRRVFDHLAISGESTDELLVEEASLDILERTLDAGTRERTRELPPRSQIEIATRAREAMGLLYAENDSLTELADRIAVSIFHLSRVFKCVTGMTLHAYREELRLREGAYRISEGERDLSILALDLGYSSHSHFTNKFRTRFGITPSQLRDAEPTDHIRAMLAARR